MKVAMTDAASHVRQWELFDTRQTAPETVADQKIKIYILQAGFEVYPALMSRILASWAV